MSDAKPRIIKKYSNRRLYDTSESAHITQDKIKEYVNRGIAFRVVSAKSGEDITRSVLLNVILDEEVMGIPLFTEEALRSIILFSGSAFRSSFSGFLEQMLPALERGQYDGQGFIGQLPVGNDRMRDQLAMLQGMLLGNSFQEYVNRSMEAMGEANREIAKSTAKMMGAAEPPPTGGGRGRARKADGKG